MCTLTAQTEGIGFESKDLCEVDAMYLYTHKHFIIFKDFFIDVSLSPPVRFLISQVSTIAPLLALLDYDDLPLHVLQHLIAVEDAVVVGSPFFVGMDVVFVAWYVTVSFHTSWGGRSFATAVLLVSTRRGYARIRNYCISKLRRFISL